MVLLLAWAGLLIGTAPARADCDQGPAWPDPSEARGTTFVGTVIELVEGEEGNAYAWQVEKVYAGTLDPGRLPRWGWAPPGCHPTVLRPGTRYLISSGYPDGAAGAASTVAYELLAGDRVRLASFGKEQPRSTAPAIYRVDTFAEALSILLGMPPTDAVQARLPAPFQILPVVFGIGAVVSYLLLRGRAADTPVQ